MPILYSIDEQKRLVSVEAQGEVSMHELIEFTADMFVKWPQGMYYDRLIDLSQVSRFHITASEIGEYAQSVRRNPGRFAYVAWGEGEKLARLYESLAVMQAGGESNFRVFHSAEEALEWLSRR